jgi:hypothetical protein
VIIYPNEKILEQYVLDEHGKYQIPHIFKEGDIFNSHMFPEFTLKTSDLFS